MARVRFFILFQFPAVHHKKLTTKLHLKPKIASDLPQKDP